jgi:hypothetical protein
MQNRPIAGYLQPTYYLPLMETNILIGSVYSLLFIIGDNFGGIDDPEVCEGGKQVDLHKVEGKAAIKIFMANWGINNY